MVHPERRACRLLMTLAPLVAAAVGCSAGGGGAIPDGGPHDAVFELALNLPDGCPPATENELGIGRPCTTGGNECASSNLQCSCDKYMGVQLAGIPCFCSRLNPTLNVPDGGTPCDLAPAGFCGSGASCCSYFSIIYYCLPNICLDQGVCPQVAGP